LFAFDVNRYSYDLKRLVIVGPGTKNN